MTISEMQNNVVRMVLETYDSKLLEQFFTFFKSNQPETDWWDEISDYEKEMIKKGEESIKKGELHTNEEVMLMAKSILKKEKV
jgi:hypothetical protein